MPQQHRHPVILPDESERPPAVQVPDHGIVACPGKVAVQMYPRKPYKGSIALPDRVADQWADCGLVLAVGGDPGKGSLEDELGQRADPGESLAPGDTVLVDTYCSKAVSGFHNKDWQASTEVRFYGCEGGQMLDFENGDASSAAVPVAYDTQLHAVLTPDQVRPVGRKILIRLCGLDEESRGGVLIPLNSQTRDCVAEVVAVGPRALSKAGQKVVFHEGALREGQRIDGTRDYFILDTMVYARLEP